MPDCITQMEDKIQDVGGVPLVLNIEWMKEEELTGTIVTLRRDYAVSLIKDDKGSVYPFMQDNCQSTEWDNGQEVFNNLKEGDVVRFNGRKWGVMAKNVSILPSDDTGTLIPKTKDVVAEIVE